MSRASQSGSFMLINPKLMKILCMLLFCYTIVDVFH